MAKKRWYRRLTLVLLRTSVFVSEQPLALAGVMFIRNDMIFTIPVTILCAILLLRIGQNTRIKGDAAIAMVSVGTLAIGYMLLNLFPKSSNVSSDVCTSLFGSTSILTLTPAEVWLSIGLSVIVLLLYVIFYNKFFAVTFDEDLERKSTRLNSSHSV